MSIFWKKFWRGFAASAAIALMLPVSVPGIAAFITGGSGGGGTPGGSDTQVQYNDAGAFGGDAGLVFNATTNALTGTGLWTVTQGSANTGVFASTGYSVTGSGTTPMIDLAGTWNTSGAASAIKVNITCTSCNSARLLDLQTGGSSKLYVDAFGTVYADSASLGSWSYITVNGYNASSGIPYSWTNGGANGTRDTGLYRTAAGIVGVRGSTSSAGGAFSFIEQTAPSAPATNGVYLYAEDNGSGKTRLMALFPTGAAQQIAIEP